MNVQRFKLIRDNAIGIKFLNTKLVNFHVIHTSLVKLIVLSYTINQFLNVQSQDKDFIGTHVTPSNPY